MSETVQHVMPIANQPQWYSAENMPEIIAFNVIVFFVSFFIAMLWWDW